MPLYDHNESEVYSCSYSYKQQTSTLFKNSPFVFMQVWNNMRVNVDRIFSFGRLEKLKTTKGMVYKDIKSKDKLVSRDQFLMSMI